MSKVTRAVAYGSVVSAALAVLLLLLDRTAFVVINEVEKVIEPCQHSGTWDPVRETCRCLGPWNGTYCGECTCQHGGQCSTLDVQVSTPGTLWGCRCVDKFIGVECEQCNAQLTEDNRCVGDCQPGFFGADCDTLCSPAPTFEQVLTDFEFEKELQLLEYGGSLNVCSGHGTCDEVGECDCQPLYYPSEDGRSSCARTCPIVDGKSCAGHGRCDFREDANVVACVCEEGYLGRDCSVECPGVNLDWIDNEPCAGRGACSLADSGDAATCDCGELYRGDACEYRCPTGTLSKTGTACSGHGECRLLTAGVKKTVCECEDPFSGPGCGCEASTTCSGHGTCNSDGTCKCIVDEVLGYSVWRGERCDRCIAGHFGSDCQLKCSSHPNPMDLTFVEGRNIHCHGRGTCAVANFGLANEQVVCGSCTGEFATESHCKDCKDHYYPKYETLEALLAADPTNTNYQNPETKSCTTYANRATCNFAGTPSALFGLPDDESAPCECDAAKADPFSFCTECQDTFYPSNLAEDPENACSQRCLDSGGEYVLEEGYVTLECVNDGVCAADGKRCECKNGFTGIDCGIGCGDTEGEQCSGHGTCVSSTLQQFLEFEIGKRGLNASRCVCSPDDDLSELEKLQVFRGEKVLDGEAVLTKRDFYGNACQHACLSAPWKDGQECNGEQCKALPIRNDDNSPILRCTQDSDCGEYKYDSGFGEHVLQFQLDEGETLTADQIKLRAAISAETRWSAKMGPFCHTTNVPDDVWTPLPKCRQRVTKDGVDPAKEEECNVFVTQYDCLNRGEGQCHFIDACQEALDDFDTWSYCYEIMRTEEPEALRGMQCAKGADTCDFDTLQTIDWNTKCADFNNIVPAAFKDCTNNLEQLCLDYDNDPNAKVAHCGATLPADITKVHLDAVDTSAFCWEVSNQKNTSTYPFAFAPLLDTSKARHLQSQFEERFLELGIRDQCLKGKQVSLDKCDALPELDQTPVPVLYACRMGDITFIEEMDMTGDGTACEALSSVKDLNPFVLRCLEGDEALFEVSREEAVRIALDRGCTLVAHNDRAIAVSVDYSAAAHTCRQVLDAHDPTDCARACGDDICADLGTTFDGKRVFQCQPKDSAVFVTVNEDGKCDRCRMEGADCSITGGNGGAEYRCVAPASLFDSEKTSATFAPCRDDLIMHVDELGYMDGEVFGVAGKHNVEDAFVPVPGPESPVRMEFDVTLTSNGRGKIVMEGSVGDIVSVLFHYNGGSGVDLNVPADDVEACPAGEGDTCRLNIVPGQNYRAVVTIESGKVTLKIADVVIVKDHSTATGTFTGVRAKGTAKARDIWVYRRSDDVCVDLHRKLGRSVTFRESLVAASSAPMTSMQFCADVESAFYDALAPCNATSREAVFSMPWKEYCAYSKDFLREDASLSEAADCGGVEASRELVQSCQSVLSHFDTQQCAKNASGFDWSSDFCHPLDKIRVPDEIAAAGCSDACVSELRQTDLASFCADKELYWHADGRAKSFLPPPCADNGAWENTVDWSQYCTKLAENKVEGYCSAASCSCRDQGGWMTGTACELSCPMGADFSPCNEDSFGGVCSYRKEDEKKADDYFDDPDNNLISNHQLFEIQGVCQCRHKDALKEEGCKVECSSEDGEEACNTRTYKSNGEDYEISSCDVGGSGVCKCMSPLTRKTMKTVSSWKGQTAEVLQFEFGDYASDSAYKKSSSFRLYAEQGAKRLMTKYFGVDEAFWEAEKLRFESNPALYDCDGGRKCDSHDVVIAQGLYGSSSFYGGTCSKRCPGVDTGEDMVVMDTGCDPETSELVATDRVSEEGCVQECLDNFRCEFTEFRPATSDCRSYKTCSAATNVSNTTVWKSRQLTRDPDLTACNGRGACGVTGQCRCDAAKYLSLTHPITGDKIVVQSDQKGTLSQIPITTLDTTPYRGEACEKVCPGYDEEKKSMEDVCSGHGVCTRGGQCQCDVGYVGINCELRCPVKDTSTTDDQTVCSGHGTCSEQRVFAGLDITDEDAKRYYIVSEAYRKWHNLCPDNTPIDYFVMPVADIYAGSVSSADIRGGPDCLPVPQEQDDPTKPYVERPEIELVGLSDFVVADFEQDLKSEGMVDVEGVYSFDREGVFRRVFYRDADGNVQQQTLFVENYARVGLYDADADGEGVLFDKFYGYKCGGMQVDTIGGLEAPGDCAKLCVEDERCTCFDYQEHYHRTFLGACKLHTSGPLVPYEIKKAVQYGTTMGLLLLDDVHGTPVPFDSFSSGYVALFADEENPESCRAPTVDLGTVVTTLDACAEKCVEKSGEGCAFFSFDAFTSKCSWVRTTSASCEEGLYQNTAGFYAITLPNTGALGATAYSRTESARIFPKLKTNRGRTNGVYVGRARPDYETAIAACDCLSNAAWGYWAGNVCQTCQKFYGTKTCSRKCPGVTSNGESCFGFGKCLWGSKDGEGEIFYDARCLCGNPAAPYSEDLASAGIWVVNDFELYVEAEFRSLPSSLEFYENPVNYNFATSTCGGGCKEGFGGLNCASSCSFCLFNGECNFSPSTVSISVPCNCIGGDYDPYNSCCPVGFTLLESIVYNDVSLLTTTLRRQRLDAQPGQDTTSGKFYDTAVFPNLETSANPSRRWCVPCPGVHETSWMKSTSTAPATACASQGQCRDRGSRQLVIGAAPSKYFPLRCSEMGEDDLGEKLWVPHRDIIYFEHENKILVDRALTYEDAQDKFFYDTTVVFTRMVEGELTKEQVEELCRDLCTDSDSCRGAVIVRDNGAGTYQCKLTDSAFVSRVSYIISERHPQWDFTSFTKQVRSNLCKNAAGDVCSLGSLKYGTMVLCADLEIADGVTVQNMGSHCKIYDQDNDEWVPATGEDCYPEVSDEDNPPIIEVDETSGVKQQYAPNANALLYNAYGGNKFTASAADLTQKPGVMRPDNPCENLPGDYFWNKDDRSQCVSASTGQTCDVQDWQACINYKIGTRAMQHLHSAMDHLAVMPHKLSVLGEDYEVSVFKATFEHRVQTFDREMADSYFYKFDSRSAKFIEPLEVEYSRLEDRMDFERYPAKYHKMYAIYADYRPVHTDGCNFYESISEVPACVSDDYAPFNITTWPKLQAEHCATLELIEEKTLSSDGETIMSCKSLGYEEAVTMTTWYYNIVYDLYEDEYLSRPTSLLLADNLGVWGALNTELLGETVRFETSLHQKCALEHLECRPETLQTTLVNHSIAGCYFTMDEYFAFDGSPCPSHCDYFYDTCERCVASWETPSVPCEYNITQVVMPDTCFSTHCNNEEIAAYDNATQATFQIKYYYDGCTDEYCASAPGVVLKVRKAMNDAIAYRDMVVARMNVLSAELDVQRENRLQVTSDVSYLASDSVTETASELSCTESFPCDICMGHCESDDECADGLYCSSTDFSYVLYGNKYDPHYKVNTDFCTGTAQAGVSYCYPLTNAVTIPSDDRFEMWVDSEVNPTELYIMAAVTDTAVMSTWLVEVYENRVAAAHSRSDHAYLISEYRPDTAKCGAEYGTCPYHLPVCMLPVNTCIEAYDESPGTVSTDIHYVPQKVSTKEPQQRFCNTDSLEFVNGYYASCTLLSLLKDDGTCSDTQQMYCVSRAQIYENDDPTISKAKVVYDDTLIRRDEIDVEHVMCIWFTQDSYGTGNFAYIQRYADSLGNYIYWHYQYNEYTHDVRYYATFYREADGSLPSGSCQDNVVYNELPKMYEFPVKVQTELTNIQLNDLKAIRNTPNLLYKHRTSAKEITGVVFEEGVAGSYVKYAHAPWVSGAQVRNILSWKVEECQHLCEKTFGCTAMHWSDNKCILLNFDTNTGCEIFEDIRNSLPETVSKGNSPADRSLDECQGDCDGPQTCKNGLRCYHGDDYGRVPTCKRASSSSYRAYDFCYNPRKVQAAMIRNPKACRLCKSYGLYSAPDLDLTFMPNHPTYSVQCRMTHYHDRIMDDREAVWTADSSITPTRRDECSDGSGCPHNCDLLPHYTTFKWDEVTKKRRCTPTRTNLNTAMFTSSSFVATQFEDTIDDVLLVLTGNPYVSSYQQCEVACTETHTCKAWQYEQVFIDSDRNIPAEDLASYQSRSTLTVTRKNSLYATECKTRRLPDTSASGRFRWTYNYRSSSWGYDVIYVNEDFANRLPVNHPLADTSAAQECAKRCFNDYNVKAFMLDYATASWRSSLDTISRPTESFCFCASASDSDCSERRTYGERTGPYAWNVLTNVNGHAYDTIIPDNYYGSMCQRCDLESGLQQCADGLVCTESSLINGIPGCDYLHEDGLALCANKKLLPHRCTLYDKVPPKVSTDEATFDGNYRIGTVERDFKPKIAFFDDGNHAACHCFDGSTAYDCSCKAESFAPYTKLSSDDTYGCSGHGLCSSLDYKCICDSGYGWMWKAAENGHPEGFTCVECPEGSYKDDTVATCTSCPLGYYQNEKGQSSCKNCNGFTKQQQSISSSECY